MFETTIWVFILLFISVVLFIIIVFWFSLAVFLELRLRKVKKPIETEFEKSEKDSIRKRVVKATCRRLLYSVCNKYDVDKGIEHM